MSLDRPEAGPIAKGWIDMARAENEMPLILIVDDDHINHMVAREVLKNDARINTADSGAEALAYLEGKRPDLVLLDIRMPGMDGFETIQKMRATPAMSDVPVVFLTSETGSEVEARCFEEGAMDFIAKPFVAAVLVNRVKRVLELEAHRRRLEAMVTEQSRELVHRMEQFDKMQEALLIGLADVIEFRDAGTGDHVKHSQLFVELIAYELKRQGVYSESLTDDYIKHTVKAAPLHDIGKIHVPDHILRKPGKLTDEEYEEIKKHTVHGAEIAEKILREIGDGEYTDIIHDIVLHHHERWDGKGYPDGLAGEDIPLCARIMAVADVFDALFEERVYKKGIKPIAATLEIMKGGRGTQFDPHILDVFMGLQPKLQLLTGEV